MDAAAITSLVRAVHHGLGRAPTRPGFAVRSPVRPGAAGWSFRVRATRSRRPPRHPPHTCRGGRPPWCRPCGVSQAAGHGL